MSFKALQNLITNTTAYTAVGASQIVLPASVIAMLTTQLAGGYYTAVSVTDGVNYEVMNIVGITAGAADVERGQDGTVAVPLAKGAQVRFCWTTAGIESLAVSSATVTLTGSGGSTVTGGPNYNVDSPVWTFTGGFGIDVSPDTGPYDLVISQTSVGAQVTVAGTGLAVVTGGPLNYNVDVVAPNFVGAGGITVSGAWPNITITNSVPPGTGTLVGVTAGAGIAITGSLTINPTVSLATVGPGAGTYGGITLNAYGQVTAIAASLITGVTTGTTGVHLVGPTSGVLGINIDSASVSGQGLVQLAPPSGSNDVANSTQAVTPAGINYVVSALTALSTPASLAVTGNQNSVTPSLYVNLLSTFSIPIPAVPAGKSVLVDLYVESYDPSNPTVVQAFGVGLFDSVGLIAGNSSIVPNNVRVLKCLINGPYTAQTLSVKTTALGGTQVIGSFYASVVRNY